MTLQEAQLIKRTAWRNMQPRTTPTADDEKYVPDAIAMLSYLGALDYAMIDLQDALESAGLFRHGVRWRVQQCYDLARKAHNEAWVALRSVSERAIHQYDRCFADTYNKIQASVMLQGVERAYNIVVALCRLVEKYNKALSGRYDFAPARPCYNIPRLLDCVKVEDYKIDSIIELNTK